MYHASRKFALLLGFCLAASPVSSLEMTAGSSSPQNDLSGVTMRLEALRAALESSLNDILTCNKKKMAFVADESVPGRDADGCIEIGGAVDTTKYEIVREKKRVAIPKSCVGSGSNGQCSISFSVADYVGKEALTLGAGCVGAGWCGVYGVVPLPSLTSDFSNLLVVARNYKKSNSVRASYKASSKILTLSSHYSGSSTNTKRGAVTDVVIEYMTMELKEKPSGAP